MDNKRHSGHLCIAGDLEIVDGRFEESLHKQGFKHNCINSLYSLCQGLNKAAWILVSMRNMQIV